MRRQDRYRLFLERIPLTLSAELPRSIGSYQVIMLHEDGFLRPLENRLGFNGWYRRFARAFLSVITLGLLPLLVRAFPAINVAFDTEVEVSLRRTLRPYIDLVQRSLVGRRELGPSFRHGD